MIKVLSNVPLEAVYVTPLLPFATEHMRHPPADPLYTAPLSFPTQMTEAATDISFMSDNNNQSIIKQELSFEVDESSQQEVISGNRIVDINYLLKWAIPLQYNHSKVCATGKIILKEEDRRDGGLVSTLKFGCNMCSRTYTYSTEDPNRTKSKINEGFVWATLAAGSTYRQTKELLGSMDIPPMSLYTFNKIEKEIKESLEEVSEDELYKDIEKAVKEEYEAL